jgi:DNA-binding CsgD family transcriptional regulator/tetratricopeptide (TPR) repeat protein
MVGRDRELGILERSWPAAGQVFVVRGAAGVGKSRLVREFTLRTGASDGLLLLGRCSPTGLDVPLRPLREAFLAADRRGLRPTEAIRPYLPALGALVPDWAGPSDAAGDRSAIVLAEGLLRLMARWSAASRSPAVLVIEDLQWSDPETLRVVEYLADNVAEQPVLVIGTIRRGEEGAGAELIRALTARRAVASIDLAPLDQAESMAMLQACLGDDVLAPGLLDEVVERSEGNPFFLEELLAPARADPSARDVPESIASALQSRLDGLSASALQLVHYAAVLGSQFDWQVVAATLGWGPKEAIEALRQAIRVQLVDAADGRYRFRHALTVEIIQSLLLPEEHKRMSAALVETLVRLHPDLEGELCQLAAGLAEQGGAAAQAAGLWLTAAERALDQGSLASAEALALRARPHNPTAADRLLLAIWVLAGEPLRALEVGEGILASGPDPAIRAEVLFDLIDAMIDAGRWGDAERYLARLDVASNPSHAARRAIGQSEVALARKDAQAAMAFARGALAEAQLTGRADLTCRALWLIGRVERGRDTKAALAAFHDAYDYAHRHGLAVHRVRSLFELGTIDMFETLGSTRLEAARQEALAVGALSTAAMIDLHLAATFSVRGRTAMTLEAATRCEEVSRRLSLSTLPMSLALRAVAHGIAGERPAMDRALEAIANADGDQHTARMVAQANGVALYYLGQGDLSRAIDAMDGAMQALRAAGGGAYDFPGRWTLLRTIADDGGAESRQECRTLEFDSTISGATLWAADAVAAAREGGNADLIYAPADRALGRLEDGFLLSLTRLLVAPCAHQDGWGSPTEWLRESWATFEGLGLANLAGRCRVALRAIGQAAPRRAHPDGVMVAGPLAACGVTAREAEVMAYLVAGCSNREIAERLHLSIRTVEKHVERLLMKTGASRPELARLAVTAGLRPIPPPVN